MVKKYEITKIIEDFAPLETQEDWDCSGWIVETSKSEVNKIMLALTVTEDVITQARQKNCDMIISHHPLFFVPEKFKDIDIYCAHTNFDKAQGGTTDTLIENIFGNVKVENFGEFLRICDFEIPVDLEILKGKLGKISPNLRYTNNKNIKNFKRIAFCAGSGGEFIEEASNFGAEALITGDLKFHTVLDSPIAVFDIGHFESEILVLKVFERLTDKKIEIVFADEKSPFNYL